jgi:hypothetical protein
MEITHACLDTQANPESPQPEGLAEELAVDIERDIRIALWNTGCWQGKPQEIAQSFIQHAMEEPTMKRALGRIAELASLRGAVTTAPSFDMPLELPLGTRVTKIKGSSWTGRVVGFYSTSFTPEGYAIESENEPGSVQIYPRSAIRAQAKEGE